MVGLKTMKMEMMTVSPIFMIVLMYVMVKPLSRPIGMIMMVMDLVMA